MRACVQRVAGARVTVDGSVTGEIGEGLCILLGVAPDDTMDDVRVLARKAAQLRVFPDEEGKMNRSLLDMGGGALVISQFTLYADCKKGRRPSFIGAAPPALAEELYLRFAECLASEGVRQVAKGVFGAHMEVSLINDGPVTILLDTAEWR